MDSSAQGSARSRGRSRLTHGAGACWQSTGRKPIGALSMSQQFALGFWGESTSSVAGSPAKTSRLPETAPDSPARGLAYGSSSLESSASCGPPALSSKTLPTAEVGGSRRSGRDSRNSDTESAPSKFLPPNAAHRTSGDACSLLPTPTASRYGSGQNGCPRDGREAYAGRGKMSLWTLAARGLLPGHPTGPLDPRYVEWMMGFPDGWTETRDSETL